MRKANMSAQYSEYKNLLVLLGTQPMQFTRLLVELGEIIAQGLLPADATINVQNGHTPELRNSPAMRFLGFLNKTQYDELITSADLLITHGGAGSIFDALNRGKKVIALARKAKFGEHVDDHQEELVDTLAAREHILGETTLKKSFEKLPFQKRQPYHSNKEHILEVVNRYILD